FGQLSPFELGGFFPAFTDGGHFKVAAQRVYGFGADPVEADGLLEGAAIVFRAGIDLAYHVYHLTQGDAPAKITNGDGIILYGDLYALAVPHRVFVDTVVYHFFEEHIDAVVGAGAIAQLA